MYIERVIKSHFEEKQEELFDFGTWRNKVQTVSTEIADSVKYIVRSEKPNNFVPDYEFDSYKEATEFIRYIYGGEITKAVEKALDFQNIKDDEEEGAVILPTR